MPDLWGYKREAIERAVKEIDPDVVEVSPLTTGLWVSARRRDGRWVTIPEYRLNGKLSLSDFTRR